MNSNVIVITAWNIVKSQCSSVRMNKGLVESTEIVLMRNTNSLPLQMKNWPLRDSPRPILHVQNASLFSKLGEEGVHAYGFFLIYIKPN